MKTKILIISVLGFVTLLLSLTVWLGNRQKAEREIQAQKRENLPNFRFWDLDSAVFEKGQMQEEKNIVIVQFHSECDLCQSEAQLFVKNQEKFKNTQILWVSDEKLSTIRLFAEKYELVNMSNCKILKSNGTDFKQAFGSSGVPQIFIYDTERRLLKHFKGETKIEAILKHIP